MKDKLIQLVKEKFIAQFKQEPILFFSPGRINIIGEHTDYNDGFVFPAAVDKGIVAAIQKTDSKHSTIYAIDKDEIYTFSLSEIKPHSAGGWQNYILGVISELQKQGIIIENFTMAFGGNIPGGAGMSSSAALENSIVFGLNELFNLKLTKQEMILISQKAEHNYVGVHCGIMDQYASMFGRENTALLLDCRTVKATSFKINLNEFKLILINTNVKHSLSDSAYNDRRDVCEKIAKYLNIKALRDASEADLNAIKSKISEEDYNKALFVIQENNRVLKASEAITSNDLAGLGSLMYASHNGLQYQYQVSCAELDFLVDETKKNDAILGARMMGGGFGGCTINLIARSESRAFKEQITHAFHQRFNTHCTIYEVALSEGTHLLQQ